MIHLIDTNLFTHQNQVNFNGEIHHSSYNHNYYTSEEGVIILEECNDDNDYSYWWIDSENGNTDYIGGVVSIFGIFDEDYDGYPNKDKNGIIELDTEFC